MLTHRSLDLPLLTLCMMCLTVVLVAVPLLAQAPVTEGFEDYPLEQLLTVTNGRVDTVRQGNETIYHWSPNTGETSLLQMKTDSPLFRHLRFMDRLQFDFRIASGEISDMGLSILGHVSGPRQYKVHQWGVAVRTTPHGAWQSRQFDLARPGWFPWDNPDGEGADGYFRFDTLALLPGTVIEFRQVRFSRALLLLKPDFEVPITWPVKEVQADGSVRYSINYLVVNAAGKPTDISARVLSTHRRFKVAFEKETQPAKSGQMLTFTLTATIGKADIDATEELYAEPLQVAFTPAITPAAVCYWQGELVRPLTGGIKRQVILTADDLAYVRKELQAGNADLKQQLNVDRTLAAADDFLTKRLVEIPIGHPAPRNSFVPDWKPGEMMPEIVNTKTGEKEFNTPLAGQVWKEYLGFSGQACENLGLAYLLTGDEKYAQKAVELFLLYARQYQNLTWGSTYEQSWAAGPSMLSSSRTATSSTYGSNWYFKGHCRLLSMIADSPSWTPEQRATIYRGFILPYAAEIIKFPGGISNMTDITNHNLLLLGIVFDDAGLVRRATMSDPGILLRLQDIDADGFSSEGRPLNYHFAAMSEYLPSIEYIEHSGLPLKYPKERLLAAFRMPYQRAALTGRVPNTGDNGRGYVVGASDLADTLSSIFPAEGWLADLGRSTTLAARLRLFRSGKKPDAGAWKSMLETKPRLFAEAGMAILRNGDTPANQVMVTLDYGRNVFHAALDRNQVTLSAFGKVFTHGTGSLYNAGSGGIIRQDDPHLQSFVTHDSLGHNLVLADQQNQMPAIGKLLAWSPQPDFQVAVSQVGGIRPGVTHTRGIALTNGIVVLLDRVEAKEPHVYDFVYHNFGSLTPGEGWTQSAAGKPLGTAANYENIIDLKRLTGQGILRLRWDLSRDLPQQELDKLQKAGQAPPPVFLDLWQLPVAGGEIYTGTTGMNNPNTNCVPDAAPSLIHRVNGSIANYLTVLEPHTGTPQLKDVAADGKGGVIITLQNGKRINVSLDGLIKQYVVTTK